MPKTSTDGTPLHLVPRLVAKPWGGRALERFGRELPPATQIGESWEVADLASQRAGTADMTTPVGCGPLTGALLSDLIAADATGLLGAASAVGGRFPLLVKLLDAREPLSVQVHPPLAYVAEHPGARHKAESWVVLSAQPRTHLYIGLEEGTTPSDVAEAAGTAAVVDLLRRVPAVPGEVHHIPAGVVHALGGGVVVAEVQTPSDTTFRLYDWADQLGREPRPLHIDEAMESLALAWNDNIRPPHPLGRDARDLGGNDHFHLARIELAPQGSDRSGPCGAVTVLQVLEGELDGDGFAHPVPAGATVVLPAVWDGALRARSSTTVLAATPTQG